MPITSTFLSDLSLIDITNNHRFLIKITIKIVIRVETHPNLNPHPNLNLNPYPEPRLPLVGRIPCSLRSTVAARRERGGLVCGQASDSLRLALHSSVIRAARSRPAPYKLHPG